jgi:hypothetical protein
MYRESPRDIMPSPVVWYSLVMVETHSQEYPVGWLRIPAGPGSRTCVGDEAEDDVDRARPVAVSNFGNLTIAPSPEWFGSSSDGPSCSEAMGPSSV